MKKIFLAILFCVTALTADVPSTYVRSPDAMVTISGTSIDWTLGKRFSKSISGNTTFTFANAVAHKIITVQITAAGANSVTWPAITWMGGVSPAQTSTATDVYQIWYDGTTFYGCKQFGISDGSKGDISIAGNTWTIANSAVTYAKMQNISGASLLLGRGAGGGAGAPQEITLGATLGMSSQTLNTVDGSGINEWNGLPLSYYPVTQVDECFAQSIGSTIFTSSVSGTGAAVTITGGLALANHPGVYAIDCGTTTTGMANLRNSGNTTLLGSKTQRFIFCLRTPTALSDGTDTYTLFLGLGDQTTAGDTGAAPGIVDGAWFQYTHTLNSGNWTGRTGSGGTYTTASGGSNVAVTASAFWWFGIEMNSTSVKFYVASDSSGVPGSWTLIGTSSSNLPTSGATGFAFQIIKSAGTAARPMYLDKWIWIP
jgi:hypothetical protein